MRFSPNELSKLSGRNSVIFRCEHFRSYTPKKLSKKMIHVAYQMKGPKEGCPLICTAIQRFIPKTNVFRVTTSMLSE